MPLPLPVRERAALLALLRELAPSEWGLPTAVVPVLGRPWPAPVWLDLAREHTEGRTHQQQIRDAVGRPG